MGKKIVIRADSIVHPTFSHVVFHTIGMHPVTFGSVPDYVQGSLLHLEDTKMKGLNVVNLCVLRTIVPRPDTHIAHAVRSLGQIPATIEVLHALGELGFDTLAALFYDKEGLWDCGSYEISLACLGSFIVGRGKQGIILRVRPNNELVVDNFEARNSKIKLPTNLIFPSIIRHAG